MRSRRDGSELSVVHLVLVAGRSFGFLLGVGVFGEAEIRGVQVEALLRIEDEKEPRHDILILLNDIVGIGRRRHAGSLSHLGENHDSCAA